MLHVLGHLRFKFFLLTATTLSIADRGVPEGFLSFKLLDLLRGHLGGELLDRYLVTTTDSDSESKEASELCVKLHRMTWGCDSVPRTSLRVALTNMVEIFALLPPRPPA